MSLEFREFPKIFRLNRECIITEKIDGTNACIVIDEDFKTIAAQSRNQILTDGKSDAFGFALWVERNKDRLIQLLGPGHHFGEWWGKGIQRGYDRPVKRLSLFNVDRWKDLPVAEDLGPIPVIRRGLFTTALVEESLEILRSAGSLAAPGFMKPEGIVVFHCAASMSFKVTLEKDYEHKGRSQA